MDASLIAHNDHYHYLNITILIHNIVESNKYNNGDFVFHNFS